MNILFGSNEIQAIREQGRFTILELDTIQVSPDHEPEPAYCVLTDVSITEIPLLESKVKMHQDLMHFYRTQQWPECRQLIELLRGSWNGEIDSFYTEIQTRLDNLETNGADQDWDGIYRPWRNSRN